MSARYGNKVGPLVTRKSSFFKKDRFDRLRIKQPNTWVRPAGWLTMPSFAPSEQKIALLMPVYEQGSNFLAFTVAGNYTVDWGDGSAPQIFASFSKAQYEYNYNTLSSTIVDGYKMAIVTITPQAGSNIEGIDFNQKYNLTGSTFPDTSPILEITLSCPNLQGFPGIFLGNVTSASAFCKNLINFVGINLGNMTTAAGLFASLISLENVSLNIPSTVTSMESMFNGCRSLRSVSLSDTSSVTNVLQMFNDCSSLITVPLFNTASVPSMNSMFNGCNSLTTVPLFNTISVNNMNSMFAGCNSLITVPLFNTASVTVMSAMFNGCRSLTSVPLFNTASVTTMLSMFNACSSLTSVPLFNTASVTVMRQMFTGCSSLISIPPFNTPLLNDTLQMFSNCPALKSVPLFNTASVGSMLNMFSGCSSLTTVPLFNTASVTIMSAMFSNCFSLTTVPLFNTASVTTMASMFSSCLALKSVPSFDTSSVTTMTSMFSGCTSLTTVNFTNTTGAGTTTSKFNTIFANCPSLTMGVLKDAEYTLSYAGCKLSRGELERIFNNLDTIGAASQTLNITSNLGAPTPTAISGTPTVGSTTITMTSTAGIVIGMQVTGTGSPLTSPRNVTFQGAGNTITLANHGLQIGDEVSFASITTTGGIIINRIYYVVNPVNNTTFQVSLSIGGAPIDLTADGSGTLRYRTQVTDIQGLNVIVSRPMTVGGAQTLSFRQLRTGTALLKGWAVTG